MFFPWWFEATRSIQAELRAQQVKLAATYNTYQRLFCLNFQKSHCYHWLAESKS